MYILKFVVFVYVDCCLYVLLVFIDIEMVFLYLVICFCLSTPGISCLSHYLTLTKVPSFSQFQIPALIAIHVYVVIYLCDSIWSVSESVYVFFYRLFIYVMPLVIQLSREEGGDPINSFKPGKMFMTVPNQDLDFQCHMSWTVLCCQCQ
jgi:hypothetical protein